MYRHPKNLPQKTLAKRKISFVYVSYLVLWVSNMDLTGYKEVAVKLSNFNGWLIMKAKRMMKNLRYIFELAVSQ